jgi:hypothetical protein
MLERLNVTMTSLSVEERQKLIKFKYRIVTGPDSEHPYAIQKKGWIRWKTVERSRNRDAARADLEKLIRNEYQRPGTVIFEYSEQDYLADKLKNISLYERIKNI